MTTRWKRASSVKEFRTLHPKEKRPEDSPAESNLVQSVLQKQRCHKYRQAIPLAYKQGCSESLQAASNFQQQYTKGQLQLHAQCRKRYQ